MPDPVLGIGVSGLLASQQQMATTAHNVSNVNTPGYSRQSAELVTSEPDFKGYGYQGRGTQVETISRSYSRFLTQQVQSNTAGNEAAQEYERMAVQLDNVLANPSTGMVPALERFTGSLQDLSTDPTSESARQVVLASADGLAERFNGLDVRLEELQDQVNITVKDGARELNALTSSLTQLNEEIASRPGGPFSKPPNDLLDKRDEIVRQISELVDVTTLVQSDGTFNVYMTNGQALVLGTYASTINTVPGEVYPGTIRLVVEDNYGNSVDISDTVRGGKLSGAMAFQSEMLTPAEFALDAMAYNLANAYNAVQTSGYDLDGNQAARSPIFYIGSGQMGAAKRISLSMTDPRALAVATEPAPGNNKNVLAMIEIKDQKMFDGGKADVNVFYETLVADVGGKTREAQIDRDAKQTLLRQAIESRETLAGVNLDEEAANLLRFQQAYAATAQVISASDQAFQELLQAVRR